MTANKVPLHFCYPPGYVPTQVAAQILGDVVHRGNPVGVVQEPVAAHKLHVDRTRRAEHVG